MAVKRIFLRSVQRDLGNGMEYCLEMRHSTGAVGINDLETKAPGGSSVKWKLDKNSGIKSIRKIYEKGGHPYKAFKNEPAKMQWSKGFKVKLEINESNKDILEKYDIVYIPDGTDTEVTIDPYIRIPPRK